MKLNPGELNRRIQILRHVSVTDADGYDADSLQEVHVCWSRFTRTSGSEAVKANADFGTIKVRFLIRYTPKIINRKMIVRHSGNDYEIVYVNDYNDAHEYIEIWCERVTLEG